MHTAGTFRRHARYPREGANWRSRLVIAAILGTALSVYVAGIFWFGEDLANDVRAGVREVHAGALIPDQER